MTNSDRLQEIRERAEKASSSRFVVEARADILYLLQLITEQQREIDRLQAITDDPKLQELENRAQGYRKQERPM